MTENTRFIKGEKQFTDAMEQMNIPAEDIREGLDFVIGFMCDNPLTDDNRISYWSIMSVAAYHAGKSKTV